MNEQNELDYYESLIVLVIKGWTLKLNQKPEDFDDLDVKDKIRFILSLRNTCKSEHIPLNFVGHFLIDIVKQVFDKDALIRIMESSFETDPDFDADRHIVYKQRGMLSALIYYIRFTEKDQFTLNQQALLDVKSTFEESL